MPVTTMPRPTKQTARTDRVIGCKGGEYEPLSVLQALQGPNGREPDSVSEAPAFARDEAPMTDEGETAEGLAFKVGYSSASQFSREYARVFGNLSCPTP
jgi:AraC-like DNA-binding protein